MTSTNKPGPFTAGKVNQWVTRDTIDECCAAYAELAKEQSLGMGTIYRDEEPEGARYFINPQGVIVGRMK